MSVLDGPIEGSSPGFYRLQYENQGERLDKVKDHH